MVGLLSFRKILALEHVVVEDNHQSREHKDERKNVENSVCQFGVSKGEMLERRSLEGENG